MSSLAWIDFDEAERQRAQRIMALFQERETRDELGLGAIRDSIADHLFPGTSTIQTRLRYMLFIPWLYRALEKRQVPEAQLRAEARDAEIRLADALRRGGESNGIIGRDAGPRLQRLPSSVYWAGLARGASGSFRARSTACSSLCAAVAVRMARPSAKSWPGPGARRLEPGLAADAKRPARARRLPPDHGRGAIPDRPPGRQPTGRAAHDAGARRHRRGLRLHLDPSPSVGFPASSSPPRPARRNVLPGDVRRVRCSTISRSASCASATSGSTTIASGLRTGAGNSTSRRHPRMVARGILERRRAPRARRPTGRQALSSPSGASWFWPAGSRSIASPAARQVGRGARTPAERPASPATPIAPCATAGQARRAPTASISAGPGQIASAGSRPC